MNKNAVLVGRGGFEAKLSSTALDFQGIQDYVTTMRQDFLKLILYIFSALFIECIK